MAGALAGNLGAALEFFVHLAVVLVPLFVGGAFLVGLLQEYLPPERVERILRRHDGGTGNVVAAGIGALIRSARVRRYRCSRDCSVRARRSDWLSPFSSRHRW